MKKISLLILLSLACAAAQASTLTGKVVRVADGDTITVLDSSHQQHRIRFLGIDAPERGQAYGNYCRQNLADKIAGETVEVDYQKRDRYGRITGTVYYDGRDINLEQLQDGCAWFYRYYARELDRDMRQAYDAAETEARKSGIGLWRDPDPVNPYDYRRSNRH